MKPVPKTIILKTTFSIPVRMFFSLLTKKGVPFAFFSLLHRGRPLAELGAIYVKPKFRGLMGVKSWKAGEGHVKGTGQRLLEFAVRVARKMGHPTLVIPKMMFAMERSLGLVDSQLIHERKISSVTRIPSDKQGIIHDAWIDLVKAKSRKQRHLTRRPK